MKAQNVLPGDTLQANDMITTGGTYFVDGNALPMGTTPFYLEAESLQACYEENPTAPVEIKIDGTFSNF